MSHVTDTQLLVKNLEALDASCKELGLELVRGQTTYKWYGRSVGDTPLPAGFTESDLGRCEHAIRIPGNHHAYEIGVVRRRDGKPGYTLMWDSWDGGKGMQAKVGEDCQHLNQAYIRNVAISHYKRKGYRIHTERQGQNVVLTAIRR